MTKPIIAILLLAVNVQFACVAGQVNDLLIIKKSQEEIKTNIQELKTLIHDVKKISCEICSVLKKKPHHCGDTSLPDGVTTVYPYKENDSKGVQAYCDQNTDGGGWTVIQNRDPEATRQNFELSWSDYVKGFGDVKGEFWLGLENIHALTELIPMELRIDLEEFDGEKKWAKYGNFKIGDASTKYVLTAGNYSGDAGDSFSDLNGLKFSTFDQDNDKYSSENCAVRNRGGWWFSNCGSSNLNGYRQVGKRTSSYYDGIMWYHIHLNYGHSYKKASMKIRPKSSN